MAIVPSSIDQAILETQHRPDFSALNPLLQGSHLRTYHKGEFVFQSGSPGQYVYLLDQGAVKIFKLADNGREAILWFCFAGELFGLAEISRGQVREVFAQACGTIQLYAIPRNEFNDFLDTHPSVARYIIEILSLRMRVLGETFQHLVTDDVETRLIKLLIRLCDHYGQAFHESICVNMPITHQDLADMIGTTRQTVTSILNSLKRDGVLTMRRNKIEVPNAQSLYHYIN